MNYKKAVFSGSFDPITKGHEDIILRALPLFDEIIVAIGVNIMKKYSFSLEQRLQWIKDTFADYKAEFKKIVWPDRPEVVKKTATVVVTSLIIGAIIFCMDTVFNAGYSAIIGLLG